MYILIIYSLFNFILSLSLSLFFFKVVKKLKLVGHPYKIFKNTAFVKDMFNTDMEVAKFEGNLGYDVIIY